MSWADEQAAFMAAGGQTVGVWNQEQAGRYAKHIAEEARELAQAWEAAWADESCNANPYDTFGNVTGAVDGAVDLIVVAIGFLQSLGIPPGKAWDIVHAANMRKVVDGHVYRRPDGQIGKPPGWTGPEPELTRLIAMAPTMEVGNDG